MESISERELGPAEVEAINQYVKQGTDLINRSANRNDTSVESLAIVQSIAHYIESLRQSPARLPGVRYDVLVLNLGALWGEQVCHTYGWTWAVLGTDKIHGVFAVVSPDRTYYTAPFALVQKHLLEPKRENTIELAFNMLNAPHVAGAHPGGYLGLG